MASIKKTYKPWEQKSSSIAMTPQKSKCDIEITRQLEPPVARLPPLGGLRGGVEGIRAEVEDERGKGALKNRQDTL